jgi:excisionase family DNA binding protein
MNEQTTAAQDAVIEEHHPVGRLLTAHEVAELLGVKASWVYEQARARRIPHLRLGRYPRFSLSSIVAWTAGLEQGPLPTRWEAPMRSVA